MSDDQDWVRWNASYWNAEAGAATARAERAEAAIERVRAVLEERRAGRFWYVRVADVQAVLDSSETPPAAPGFGTASPATAELAARATSGGRMSLDLPVRLEDEPPTAAPVPEERSDEEG